MKGKNHVLMEGAPGASGGGTAAPSPAPAPSSAPASAPAAGSQDGAGSGGTAGGGSALSAGSGAEGGNPAGGDGGTATPWGWIPEKFQVKKEDGSIDHEASARKVEEHRSNLEKRLGEGGVRPKTSAEYKMPEPPEALKGLAMDEAVANKFRDDAHKAGLSQAQFEFVMGEYFKFAPALAGASQQVSAEETIASLKETWGEKYQENGRDAWRGMERMAQASGLTTEEVDRELGNNVMFNRIMAAVGAQMREDTPPNPGGSNAGDGYRMAQIAKIQASPEFRDPKNPGHQKALADWQRLVTAGVPDTPV